MRKSLAAGVIVAVAGTVSALLWMRHGHTPQSPPEAPTKVSAPAVSWQQLDVAETLYDGKLGQGWQDWGWGPHELPKAGPAKVVFAGYGGIILRHDSLTGPYGLFAFRYKAPREWPDFLQVSLKSSLAGDAQFPLLAVSGDDSQQKEDGWREVRLSFAQLNPQGVPFDRISISARSVVPLDWVAIDKVLLTKPASGSAPSSAPSRRVGLRVSCAVSHPISPLIYGAAQGAWESGITATRIGGNPTSRYNWELGAWNAANDWFFENGTSINLGATLDEAVQHGAFNALTVPLIGWVAKDATSVSFPVSKFPGQRKYDPHRPEVGDGYRPDGKPIAPGPPSQTSVPAPPELIGSWIRNLREKDRLRGKRAVAMYILDNEPALWNSTHRDVHPDPVGYDELLDRTIHYATEVRKADPDALIAGPAEWGWLNFSYSAKDIAAGKFLRPDRRSHGDVPLIPWYLRRVAEFEKKNGVRLLDYLDVHFYPAAERVYGAGGAVDDAGRALRLRTTRALWDPSYSDESWVDEPIRLLPQLREWVLENHPGLKISIGEWSFGGEHDISGALATAEALGRFGQQGLDAAFYWDGPKTGTSSYWAFRAFRNFDGQGARFLDQALDTRGEESVSIFGSRDPANPGHLVLILVNRDALYQVAAQVDLTSCGEPAEYRAFGYRAGSTGLDPLPDRGIDKMALNLAIPPYSIQVLDVTLRQARPDAAK